MKRVSQTIKVALALFVAVFANGMVPTAVAYAAVPPEDSAASMTQVTSPQEEVVMPSEEITPPEPVFAPLASFTTADEETSQSMLFGRPSVVKVVPEEPSKNDVCGTKDDQYTIPTVLGVEYWRGNTKLTNGQTYSTYNVSSVTISAKAKPGYELIGKKEWNLKFSNDKCKVTICHRTASKTNPYVSMTVDLDAVDGDTGNDHGQGDHFKQHTGPIFPAVGQDGKWGDIIPAVAGHGGLNWTKTGQAILENDCNTPVEIEVTPGPCAYHDKKSNLTIDLSGTLTQDAKLVVYNSSNHEVYSVVVDLNYNDEIVSPDFPITVPNLPAGTYTVKLFDKGTHKEIASSTATVEFCKYVVTPKAPKIIDLCYGDKDMIYISYTKGVIYKVNGYVKTGWVSYNGTTLEVTAEAKPGYVLSENSVTSWTFEDSDFTDEQCLTVVKTGKVANDTNEDGVIGVGDTVTWEIKVTNTSNSAYENFYVTVEDEGVELENDGLVGYLGAGESVILEATSTLTVEDLQACKATNTATFFGWRAHKPRNDALSLYSNDNEKTVKSPLATGSDSAELDITCPTPGSGGSGEPETPEKPGLSTPEVLPATGPAPVGSPLLALAAAAVAYGATFFLQQRRNLSAATASKR